MSNIDMSMPALATPSTAAVGDDGDGGAVRRTALGRLRQVGGAACRELGDGVRGVMDAPILIMKCVSLPQEAAYTTFSLTLNFERVVLISTETWQYLLREGPFFYWQFNPGCRFISSEYISTPASWMYLSLKKALPLLMHISRSHMW